MTTPSSSLSADLTIGKIITDWREASGLRQEEFSALTYEIADWLRELDPVKNADLRGIKRQYISFLENDGVKRKVTPRILKVIAFTASEALRRAGNDPADGETMYHVLMMNNKEKITTADVGPLAAELYAVMTMVRGATHESMYRGFIASAKAQIKVLQEAIRRDSNAR